MKVLNVFFLLWYSGFLFAGPIIEIDGVELQAGMIPAGDEVVHVATIHNRGDADLRIHRVQKHCGCTRAELEKDLVPPGESVRLTLVLDTTGRRGAQNSRVTLHSNAGNARQSVVTIIGEVVPLIQITPQTLNFQRLTSGAEISAIVEFRHSEGKAFEFTSTESANDRVQLEWLESEEEGALQRLRVTPNTKLPPKSYSDVLLLRSTDQAAGRLRVLVLWQIGNPVQVTPMALSLRVDPDQGAVTRYVMVSGSPDLEEPFKVEKVDWPGREVEITWEDTGRFGWRISIKDLEVLPEMHREELIIQTNAKGHETLTLPVRVLKR